MKTTFGAPLSEVVVVLFTGSMRAPTNCVSCRKGAQARGKFLRVGTAARNRFAPLIL